jgi:hypothetical protein
MFKLSHLYKMHSQTNISHSLVLGLEGSECINVNKFSCIKQTFRK